MNYFYISKKINYLSGWLNVLGSLAWIILIFLIYYYHFFVLIDRQNKLNYAFLMEEVKDFTSEDDSSTSGGVISALYAPTFIQYEGFGKFFSKEIFSVSSWTVTYWTFVSFLFWFALVCYIIKTIFSSLSLIAAWKAKSMLYIYVSLINLFLPLIGGVIVIYIKKSYEKIYHKKSLPCQWIKFKCKNLFSNLFLDAKFKNN